MPATCPNTTEISWSYDSLNELPQNPNCISNCPNYINNLDYTRQFWANRHVKQVRFRRQFVDMESGFDQLDIFTAANPTAITRMTGSLGVGWDTFNPANGAQNRPIVFRFTADGSVTRRGFNYDRVAVCTDGTSGLSSPAQSLSASMRTTGVLLGTGDVVYFYVSTTSQSRKLNIALWGPSGDFDVYVRCGAFPTTTVYDARGFSGNSQEFLTINDPGTCPVPGTRYIAVHSHSGSGPFNLFVSGMYNTRELNAVKVGMDFQASSADLSTAESALQSFARMNYGQLEGQHLLRGFDLYNNTGTNCNNCGGTACDICFKNANGRSYCCENSGKTIQLFRDNWQYETLAHEWGHKYLAAGDEYTDASGPQCGHSNMASPWGSNNNFCYQLSTSSAYDFDHNADRASGAPATPLPAVWNLLNNGTMVPKVFFETPDNYDFFDHDFNSTIVVTRR